MAECGYRFGPFFLNVADGDLQRDGAAVPLGRRGLKLLTRLLQSAGTLVSKDDLLEAAWPGLVVEEGNLTVQIAALRHALGDTGKPYRWIVTASGRGYRFAAPVALAPAPRTRFNEDRGDLPVPSTSMVGRDTELAALQAAFARNRLVTLTGAGGSGKTRLAIEFAHNYATDPRNRVTFLPLETVHRPGEVADRLEIALGLSTAGGRSATRVVVDHLRYSPRLLVIDNCEHLVEEVAELASQILAQSPTSAILATSRENLALPEEYLFRLCPLEVPPPKPDLSAEEVLEFASVQLFAERAKAKGSFAIDRDATAIVEICRRLEGMPLAIELAAARLSHMPITALRDGLRDQLRLLTGDDRQAPPRQRTLEATLAWSYRLLTEAESVLLRRLGTNSCSTGSEGVKALRSKSRLHGCPGPAADEACLFLKAGPAAAGAGEHERLLLAIIN